MTTDALTINWCALPVVVDNSDILVSPLHEPEVFVGDASLYHNSDTENPVGSSKEWALVLPRSSVPGVRLALLPA
ncbi:hypothetical protein GCM10010436_49910 [Paractinoplanes durhamensis]